jgi:hypothetical protein
MNTLVSFVDGRGVEVRPGEPLLDACRRTAVPITYSYHRGAVLDCGTRVHYHLRLGKVSCSSCASPH